MNAAIALKNSNRPKIENRKASRLAPVKLPAGKRAELLKLLGWDKLPESLLQVVEKDLEVFEKEINDNFSTIDHSIRRRRSRVQYWLNNYRNGTCSLETARIALSA